MMSKYAVYPALCVMLALGGCAGKTGAPVAGSAVKAPEEAVDQKGLTVAAREELTLLAKEAPLVFTEDGEKISSELAARLDKHGTFLRTHPAVTVLIEGHTDQRGSAEYNIALGERRAKAVARYLQTLGVQSSQLMTVSYGEEKPVNQQYDEAAFGQNRRAVLVY